MADVTPQPFKPKELKGICALGALFLDQTGINGTVDARLRVQADPSRTTSQNYYHEVDYNGSKDDLTGGPQVSQRLLSIPNAMGGILPSVNTHIGAPLCTFAYGGITPSEVTPYFDLIKGPASADLMIDGRAYNPQFTGTAEAQPALGSRVEDDASFGIVGAQEPYIPIGSREVYDQLGDAKPVALKSYNIWQRVGEDETTVKYRQNSGPVGQAYIQRPGEDEMSILVTGNCKLKRVFPLSKDLLYEPDARILYPADTQYQVSYRDVQAKASVNCGFQLEFKHGEPAVGKVTQLNSSVNGSIQIEWGDDDFESKSDELLYTVRFRLTLTTNAQPIFEYFNARTRTWTEFPVNGPVFAIHNKSDAYYVFVHFAGPVMLIGFGPDVAEWNAFAPPRSHAETEDRETFYPPMISADATISAEFQYVTSKFRYGPIAFNNFHPENATISRINELAGTNLNDLGFVRAKFKAPVDRQTAISGESIQEQLTTHRVLDHREALDEEDGRTIAPTYYGDWRSRQAPQELFWAGEPVEATDPETEKTYAVNDGYVLFDTTFEGPLFFHLKAPFSDEDEEPDPLIRNFKKFGDLSPFCESWVVSYTIDGSNSSILRGTATVTLKNLPSTRVGRKIFALIQENMFVITLGGGYDKAEPYFQGFITSQRTVNGEDNVAVTTLELQDIATFLTENMNFPQTYVFTGVQYNNVIRSCMEVVGLDKYYREQTEVRQFGEVEEETQEAFDGWRASFERRVPYATMHSALSSIRLTGSWSDAIMSVIQPTLEFVASEDGLPILYWDQAKGRIRVDWRSEQDLLDELEFIGEIQGDNVRFLPNSFAEYQHGMLMSEYEELTQNDVLYTDFIVQGTTLYGPYAGVRRHVKGYSLDTLNQIEEAFEDDESPVPEDLGYVGFRKWLYVSNGQAILQDVQSIENWVDELVRVHTKVYQSINFDCYVTRPLKHMGRFIIKTFLGDDRNFETDAYYYKSVTYRFDKPRNIISATIQGETYPTLVSGEGSPIGEDTTGDNIG